MMSDTKQREIHQSKAENRQQIEESEEEILEDSCSDNSESDSNTEPTCSSLLPKSSKSNELSITQPERSCKKRRGIPVPNTSKPLQTSKPSDNRRESKKAKITFSITIVLVLFVGIYFDLSPSTSELSYFNEKNIDEEETLLENRIRDFGTSIDDISHIFKNQASRIWDEIYAGVVDILHHPKKRSVVFMFSNHYDPMICLAKMIANATKTVLRTDNILWLEPFEFGNEHGLVIEKFQEPIREQKIVVVENLLAIHPDAMRAFHNLCDSENPLVEQTIYILTMIATGYKKNDRPVDFVEKQLIKKLQGKIKSDKLQPLIARVTDGAIIPVQLEPDMKSCPLRY